MKYSLIFPLYNEEENIDSLYKRSTSVLRKLRGEYELIFVNDGSSDKTPLILFNLHKKDDRVKIINFSRNFGHQAAVSAGLKFAIGDRVAILDADLQDPPEVLPVFFKKISEGYDVAYAVRQNRQEGLAKKLAYGFFYRMLRRVANINIPLDSGDFCVMNRKVVDAVNSLPERNRFVRGLRSWVGFRQVGITYARQARAAGSSKYNMSRLLKLAFDGIFSFSYVPLQFMFYLGSLALLLSIVGSVMAIYFRFFTTYYNRVPGFATTIILVMFIGGLQLFSIGLVGEYLRRVYDEIKNRPQYIVDSTVGLKNGR